MSVVTARDLEGVMRRCVFRNEREHGRVCEYLRNRPALIPLIEQAVPRLQTYLPGLLLRLQVGYPKTREEGILLGIVETDLPETLVKRGIRHFEQGIWWREHMEICNGQLQFIPEREK